MDCVLVELEIERQRKTLIGRYLCHWADIFGSIDRLYMTGVCPQCRLNAELFSHGLHDKVPVDALIQYDYHSLMGMNSVVWAHLLPQ